MDGEGADSLTSGVREILADDTVGVVFGFVLLIRHGVLDTLGSVLLGLFFLSIMVCFVGVCFVRFVFFLFPLGLFGYGLI